MASLISRVDPGVCGYRPEQAEETLENVTKIVVSLNWWVWIHDKTPEQLHSNDGVDEK